MTTLEDSLTVEDVLSTPRWVVLCDLDGTVALNDGHRGHFDWHLVANDKPNENVCDLVRILMEHYKVVFVSGRMEQCRADSLVWIENHIAPCQWPVPGLQESGWYQEHTLFMRPDGDMRPDDIVKEEIYRSLIEPQYKVKFVIDDRNKVVVMWRRLGLTCLQVADGDF